MPGRDEVASWSAEARGFPYDPRGKLRSQLPLLRRDSIGPSYHVLTFDAERGHRRARRAVRDGARRGVGRRAAPAAADEPAHRGRRPSILIKVVGEGTRRMAHASSGEPFDLLAAARQPLAPCPPEHRRSSSPAASASRRSSSSRASSPPQGERPVALYGGRTANDLPLDDELAQVAELHVPPRTARAAPAAASPRCSSRSSATRRGPSRSTPAAPTHDGRGRGDRRGARRAVRGLARDADGLRLRRVPRLPGATHGGRLPLRVHRGALRRRARRSRGSVEARVDAAGSERHHRVARP